MVSCYGSRQNLLEQLSAVYISEFVSMLYVSEQIKIRPMSGYAKNGRSCIECAQAATKEALFEAASVTVLRWYCDGCVTKASLA